VGHDSLEGLAEARPVLELVEAGKNAVKETGIVLNAVIYVSHGGHDVVHARQLNRNTQPTERKTQTLRRKLR